MEVGSPSSWKFQERLWWSSSLPMTVIWELVEVQFPDLLPQNPKGQASSSLPLSLGDGSSIPRLKEMFWRASQARNLAMNLHPYPSPTRVTFQNSLPSHTAQERAP